MASTGLKVGGKYEPSECQSLNKVAIIVPYRNRKNDLKIFLRYMHPFLQRQQLEYVVVVVEQSEGLPFNRGMLMNIGFKETQLQEIYQCFIFHDVDLLPENDGNLYSCPEEGKPRQMAFAIDVPTPLAHFGGVTAFSAKDFQNVNGFSNLFWGWGNEDDDLYQRVLHHNLTVTRMFEKEPSLSHVTRYIMLDHPIADPNPDRIGLLLDGIDRMSSDGLNNLYYKKIFSKYKPLYIHIYVEIYEKYNNNSR
ncbi:hypothetical protein DAPPUDRAFT_111185 [Daphnia pulex]|uniref:Uncharacterized protein n=1 Tax=Daphnia pulex TaxID=6669 RepID=E9H8G5_DAPPU|nr:hypothetical protein DAPPUDRAFT_111185 [Daphnia pulex]|eukprot:EFX71942.1 hypothetical protein DAPPUDRAFT_111185 [Daphnia pulex]